MNFNKYTFPRRIYKAFAPMENAQIDLFDCLNGYFILTYVDVFSRKCELSPIHSKNATDIQDGLEIIFHNLGGMPSSIQCDKEGGVMALKEFFDKNNITLYHVNGSWHKYSCPIVERLHREMVDFVRDNNVADEDIHMFLYENFPKYHNNKPHKTLNGITPNEAFNGNIQQHEINKIQDEREEKIKEDISGMRYYRTFKVGDEVRVLKPRKLFKQKFESFFYDEVYTVQEVLETIPTTYKLEGINDKSFYANQLQKATYKTAKSKKIITINDELNNNEINRKSFKIEKSEKIESHPFSEKKPRENKMLKGLTPAIDSNDAITTRSTRLPCAGCRPLGSRKKIT